MSEPNLRNVWDDLSGCKPYSHAAYMQGAQSSRHRQQRHTLTDQEQEQSRNSAINDITESLLEQIARHRIDSVKSTNTTFARACRSNPDTEHNIGETIKSNAETYYGVRAYVHDHVEAFFTSTGSVPVHWTASARNAEALQQPSWFVLRLGLCADGTNWSKPEPKMIVAGPFPYPDGC
ncbi:uncharacterized protein I303_108283 [Kwoniella dejecticola CBS 10117]|uniref:Uncharacterized protein n=1 Tax=Kwoniella dejecticola CBS 10117 TaxID=1296121 RepID=A0A1A5ZXV3_9TREE|nr:uncharacterized protein I303_07390 [Kwoniella dejecticola CBS 10117]OBR82628.1 hypothetical protein I303_07390 [Kwoniella dejecticola CBS 10117]